jgi:nicotinate-nucleotide adenylyltransferase
LGLTSESVAEQNPCVGVLGGSFDPIHTGHIALARAACDRLGLAELLLIPAAQPWQKGTLTDGQHRARMIERAVAGDARMRVDHCELKRGGSSYTIDTLRELRARFGPATALVLVIGADQMERFDTWHDWRSILQYAHLGVARRNDAVLVLNCALQVFYNEHWVRTDEFQAQPAGCVVEVDMVPHDASATEVRALLAAPPSPARDARLAQIVPAPVLDYIGAHHLYN